MWPFSKKYSIAKCGILERYIDWHSHLLPGVDDGVQTMEESLQALASYEQLRVKEVWLTPHVMENIPNTTALLHSRYAELKFAYKGPIILRLAAEYMLDNLFENRLQQGDLLTLGKEGKHLLVETPYFNPPYGLHNILLRIKAKGYIPVLAHPERYVYMEQEDYEQLKRLNIGFQLSLPSLVGAYGADAKRKAQWMLKNMYYQFSGTDTHSLKEWETIVRKKQLTEEILHMM